MLKRAMQIPAARLEIAFRVEQILRLEIVDLVFARPFQCRFLAHLHETALARAADFLRIEPALTPHHRFHQHRVELMFGRDRFNERIKFLKARRTYPFVKCV